MTIERDYRRLSPSEVKAFRNAVYRHFRENARDLPWRRTNDPYRILVSEIMLQQTQVERVLQKYDAFVERFPRFETLAAASLRDVLAAWQGLGYNRRAMALHQTAQRVVAEFGGNLPDSVETLKTLPGIGGATAGALVAFAFHKPSVFVETNIRRVFIYFFFRGENRVADRQIFPLVEQTLDRSRVRIWYYALMDHGAMLKTAEGNPNRRSAHYHRQSSFLGSDRQIRGLILRGLIENHSLSEDALVAAVGKSPARVKAMISQLVQEGFLSRTGDLVQISS
ncbi:MAG: A/G-specific adenine glycosylase [Desulfomonile sp.]|nr:A/G-specific adenine glycosylase [Desulfomonile sp.]